MEKTVFPKPQFVEGLTFRVKPEEVERYMQLEEEIWVNELCKLPGFMGSETWVSEDKPGEVTSLYFWASEEDYHGIDQDWLAKQKEKIGGLIDSEFVSAWHGEDRRFRVREYR